MSKNFDSFRVSPELFERTIPRKHVKRSKLFRLKLRVFCTLHRPVSLKSRLYHYFVTGLILFSCILVNIFDTWFTSYSIILMSTADLFLTGILTAELILRLWSSDCISDFNGFNGKKVYLMKYGLQRGLDLMAIFTFGTFVCFQTFSDMFGTVLRLLHVFQVFQTYRLILPLLKLMISTVLVQLKQLIIAFIFASIIFVIMTFTIYLKEMETFGIFDAFWFTFITLTTIGYGDIVPQTTWGKVLTVILALIGVSTFQLPANIFGTGLAIKLKEEQKKVLSQNPAANLIQSFWKCYATDKESKNTSVWNSYQKQRPINEKDKQVIGFILRYRFFRARRQFKILNDPERSSDDSETQLDLLRKVSLIENSLTELKDKTHELRIEYDLIFSELQQIINHFNH